MLDAITSRVLGGTDTPGDDPATYTPQPHDLQEATAYDILGNDRRCHVIRTLNEVDATTLGELATQIALFEADVGSGQPYKRAYVSLLQTHLPKLDDVDAIDYDADSGAVRPGRNLEGLVALLEFAEASAHGGDSDE